MCSECFSALSRIARVQLAKEEAEEEAQAKAREEARRGAALLPSRSDAMPKVRAARYATLACCTNGALLLLGNVRMQ